MDLGAAARAGISFFTHKYTEGTSTKHHPAAAMNAARAAGIPFLGAYMVPRTPGPSIANQVDYLIRYADAQTPWWRDFPGWFWQMDTEHWSYDKVSGSTGAAACRELERRTGKQVIHYAPNWAYGNDIPGDQPLWASSYVTGAGDFKALASKVAASRWAAYSGRTPAILQYSSSATIGRQPTCDANLFRGDLDGFARLIGSTSSSSGSALEAVEGATMFVGLASGERWAVGPSGPVLITWPEWTASFTEDKAKWPPVLIVGSAERVDAFRPGAAAALSAEQLAELVAELKNALGDLEPALTMDEVTQAVAKALATSKFTTSINLA
jgi:hypothetical protein